MFFIARLFSYLCHPLLVLNYASLLLLFFYPDYSGIADKSRWLIIAIVFFNTFFVPFLYVLFLLNRKQISSVQMDVQQDRQRPLAFSAVMLGGTAIFLFRNHFSGPLPAFILSAAISIVLAFIVNHYYRISLHMIAMGGWTALAILSLEGAGDFYRLAAICLLAGITGTSRLYLGAHSLRQVYTGFLSGFVIVVLILPTLYLLL